MLLRRLLTNYYVFFKNVNVNIKSHVQYHSMTETVTTEEREKDAYEHKGGLRPLIEEKAGIFGKKTACTQILKGGSRIRRD